MTRRAVGWRRTAYTLALALCAGAGCMAPTRQAPRVALRTEAPLAGLPAGAAGWPAAEWWKDFRDAQLDALVELATARAPALDVAAARYRLAAVGVAAARADARPQLSGLASASRAKIDSGRPRGASPGGAAAGGSGSAGGGGFQLPSYVTSVVALADFSYDFDWWGKHRAAIEGALDQEHAALAEQGASLAALQYGVAAAYFDWLGIELRLAQAAQSTDVNARLVAIAEARVKRGVDPPQTLEAARAQLAAARAQTAQLEGAASLDTIQIAALCGVTPAELPRLDAHALPTPATQLPEDARVRLLARRPDIVASRWQVQSASRDIDQARAAFFPDVSLNALGAVLRSYPTPGPDSTLRFGTVGLSAMLPLFDGGRRQAAFDRSEAALDLAIAQYNETVIDAAQDVNRNIVQLGALARERQERAAALAAASAAYAQAQARAQRGVDDPRQTLAALGQLIAQRDAAVALDAQALATQVSLIHALGGGYRSDDGAEQPPATLDSMQETSR